MANDFINNFVKALKNNLENPKQKDLIIKIKAFKGEDNNNDINSFNLVLYHHNFAVNRRYKLYKL